MLTKLQYLKDPANKLNDLYIRYPDGGEYGWYAFVYEYGNFAYWDTQEKRWKLFDQNAAENVDIEPPTLPEHNLPEIPSNDDCISGRIFPKGLEKFPALQYLKDPVDELIQLYIRYPDGGEYGWYAFVYEYGNFAYWDTQEKRWKLLDINGDNNDIENPEFEKITLTQNSPHYTITADSAENILIINSTTNGEILLQPLSENKIVQITNHGYDLQIGENYFEDGVTVFCMYDAETSTWTINSILDPKIPDYSDVAVDKMSTSCAVFNLGSYYLITGLGGGTRDNLLFVNNQGNKNWTGIYQALENHGSSGRYRKIASGTVLHTVRVKNGNVYLSQYDGKNINSLTFISLEEQEIEIKEWANETFQLKDSGIEIPEFTIIELTDGWPDYTITEETPASILVKNYSDNGVIVLPNLSVDKQVQIAIKGKNVNIQDVYYQEGVTVFCTFDFSSTTWVVDSILDPVIPDYSDLTVDRMLKTAQVSSAGNLYILENAGDGAKGDLVLVNNEQYQTFTGIYQAVEDYVIRGKFKKIAAGTALNTVRVKDDGVYISQYDGKNISSLKFINSEDLKERIDIIEETGATNLQEEGEGNAVTDITKEGNVLTVSKDKTFSEQGHSHSISDINNLSNSLDAKENVFNKKTSLADNSDVYYPTQKAVKTAIDAKQDSLGFTPENSAYKITSFQTTPDDTHYPSEKLVKDSLNNKSDFNHTHSFADLQSKPTTILGYGIGDAYTKTEIDNKFAAIKKEIVLTKTGNNGYVYPSVFPADRNYTISGYRLGSNAQDFSVTINSVNYTKSNIVGAVLGQGIELILNDVTIKTGYTVGNVILTLL